MKKYCNVLCQELCRSGQYLPDPTSDPAGSKPDPHTLDPVVSGRIRAGSTKFTGYLVASGSGSGAPLTAACKQCVCLIVSTKPAAVVPAKAEETDRQITKVVRLSEPDTEHTTLTNTQQTPAADVKTTSHDHATVLTSSDLRSTYLQAAVFYRCIINVTSLNVIHIRHCVYYICRRLA